MSKQSFPLNALLQPQVTLVVIDSAADNFEQLVAGVEPGAQVLVLYPGQNGVQQVTEAIAQHRPQSVHLIAHGSPGCLYLGDDELSLTTLESHADAIASWFPVGAEASLVLYGCRVAAGDAGEEFLQKLHHLTGAQLLASSQPVGAAHLGGQWELDVSMGRAGNNPVPHLMIREETRETYAGVLGLVISQRATSDFAPPTDQDNSGDISTAEIINNPANDLVDGDQFGDSVAIFGRYAVVGIPGDNPTESVADVAAGNTVGQLGAAAIYEQQPDGSWVRIEEIRPDNNPATLGPVLDESLVPGSSLAFGTSVAVSQEGDIVRVAIGDPLAGLPSNNPMNPAEPVLVEFGAVYIYERDLSDPEGSFEQVRILSNVPDDILDAELDAEDQALVNGRFGEAVALSSDGTVAIGAPNVDLASLSAPTVFADAGRVYVFDSQGNQVGEPILEQTFEEAFQEQQTSGIVPANNNFGASVALNSNNNQLIVGSPGGSREGAATEQPINGQGVIGSGTAYVFSREASDQAFGNPQQLASPLGPNNAVQQVSLFESEFGASVSISTVVDPATGVETDYAIVGAPRDDTFTQSGNDFDLDQMDLGAAYVFRREGDVWVQVQRLEASDNNDPDLPTTAPDGTPLFTDFDLFGSSVSISGEFILVGAQNAGEFVNSLGEFSPSGAAYVFQLEPTSPTESEFVEVEAIRSLGVGTPFDSITDTTDLDAVNEMSFGRSLSVTGSRSFGAAVAIFQDPETGAVSGLVGAPTDQTVIGQDDSTGGLDGEPERDANDLDDIDDTGSVFFLAERLAVTDVIFNARDTVEPQPATTDERGPEDNIVSDEDTVNGFEITIVYNGTLDTNFIPNIQFFLNSEDDTPPAGEPNITLGNLNLAESRFIEVDGIPNGGFVAVFDAIDENVQFDINNPQFDLEITGARNLAGAEQEPALSPELDFLTDVFTIDTLNPTLENLATAVAGVGVENFFNTPTLTVSGGFSEAVTGGILDLTQIVGDTFAATDDSFVLAPDNPQNFSFTVTPTAEGVFNLVIPEGTFTDIAGNENAEIVVGTRTFDETAPNVAILPNGVGTTVNGEFTVTATFTDNLSPEIVGFGDDIANDFVVTNGVVSDVTFVETQTQVDGSFVSTFTFTVAPSADIAGTEGNSISFGVAAGAAVDLAGNANTASPELSVIFDGLGPSVTSLILLAEDGTPDDDAIVEQATFTVAATFSEPVDPALFDLADIAVTNGTVVSVIVNPSDPNPTAPTQFLIGIEALPGPVTVGIVDGATNDLVGNPSQASVTPLSVEFVPPVNLPPVITITDDITDPEIDVLGDAQLTFGQGLGNAISIDDEGTGPLTVTLSVDITQGTLSLNPAALPNLQFTVGDGTEDTTLTFTGLEEDINAALEGLVFDPTNIDAAVDIAIEVTDAGFDLDGDGALDLLPETAADTAVIDVQRVETDARHDFDGNGTSDLIFQNPDGSSFIVFLDSDGISVSVEQQDDPFVLPTTTFTEIVGSGSFGADALPDLVLQDPNSGAVAIAETTLTGGPLPADITVGVANITPITPSVPTQVQGDPNFSARGVGDFNDDGEDDLLFRNQITGETVVWFLDENGEFIQESGFGPTITDINFQIEAVGDFNGDGAADLAWRNVATGQNLIWFTNFINDAVTVTSASAVQSLSTNFSLVGSGDYNGDQLSDLLFRDNATGESLLRLMNGASILNTISLSPLPGAPALIVQN